MLIPFPLHVDLPFPTKQLLRRLAEQQQVVMRRAVPTPMGPVFALPLEKLPQGRSCAMASAPPLPGSAAAARMAQRAAAKAAKAEKKASKAAVAEAAAAARAAGSTGKAKKAGSAKLGATTELTAASYKQSESKRGNKNSTNTNSSTTSSRSGNSSDTFGPPPGLMPPPQPWLSTMINPAMPPSAKAIAAAAARAGIAPVVAPFQFPGHSGPSMPPQYAAPPYLMPPAAVPPAAAQPVARGSTSTDNLVMLGGLAERRGASEEAEEALRTGRGARSKRQKTRGDISQLV